MGSSSGKSLPQLLGDEGHEGGEQGQGRGHTVIQDAGGHLCVREDQRRLHMLLNTDTEPAERQASCQRVSSAAKSSFLRVSNRLKCG